MHNRVSHIGPRLLLLVVVPWGCDFKGCDFKGCDLKGCDFKGCDLKNHLKTIEKPLKKAFDPCQMVFRANRCESTV